MRFFGEATGTGNVTSLPGAIAIYCGLNYGVFNIALLEQPVEKGWRQPGLEDRLNGIGRHFRERATNWSFWLCEDFLDTPGQKRARQVMNQAGLRPISYPPGMIAPALAQPRRPLPDLELRPVNDVPTRQAFCDVTSICFEIPIAISQQVYTPPQAWAGAYQGFVGFANGRPTSIVATVTTAGVIGIYSLGTIPQARGQGYGEATMRAAVAAARSKTGLERVVLQSTEAGYPLYRRMGFQDATRFTVYLTK